MSKQDKKAEEKFNLEIEKLVSHPIMVEAIHKLKISVENKPKEYQQIYNSIKNLLDKNKEVHPRSIEFFLNWWIFEKHGGKGMEVYHIKIEESDFVEYSKFKEDLMYKRIAKPLWIHREDSKWVLPKSFREPKKETDYKTEILAYDYRRQVDPSLEFRNGAEWLRVKGGKGRIATVFSQIQKSKWKKDEKQLKKIIEFLNEFPEAQKLAIRDLEAL